RPGPPVTPSTTAAAARSVFVAQHLRVGALPDAALRRRVASCRARRHAGELEAPDIGRPQAREGDEVAVLPVHAGDARVFSVPAAVLAGHLLGDRLGLARPRDDAAGVVALDVTVFV